MFNSEHKRIFYSMIIVFKNHAIICNIYIYIYVVLDVVIHVLICFVLVCLCFGSENDTFLC